MDEPDATAPQRVDAELARCREAALRHDRPDLVARLDAAHRALSERDLSVVVVGEFKQGKSSLINAIVGTEVCPVDHDVVTAVPTIVRFGETPTVLVHAGPTGTGPTGSDGDHGTPIPFESIRDYVRERDDDAEGRPIRSVEIQIDRRILRSGLMFVDSPGVGGLESAEGTIALGVLNMADAVLFVSDASQELTLPELEFMRSALERCPRLACVVTKVDLYPEWRRIVELDRGHLSRASLAVEVIPVSSFVRMRAVTGSDAALNEESGFPVLMELLRREVLEPGALIKAARAAAEVEFVTEQLRQGLEAEARVITSPEGAGEVVARLSR
jgi:Dynamin family